MSEPATSPLHPIAPDLERAVRTFARDRHLPGAAVGIVVDDGLAWSYAVGTTRLGAGAPIDGRTLFRIASITKTFTATAIVQLRDAGRLRLDDPVVRYLPEVAAMRSPHGPIEEVTLRRLLTHTAGMPIDVPAPLEAEMYPFEGYEIGSILRSIDGLRPFAAPGTIHQYSNVGFQLLGEVVARVSGMSWEAYLAERVTGPLGMHATVLAPAGELAGRAAQGYQAYDHDDRLVPARDLDSQALRALGGLWSSVEDLARWVVAQLGPYGPEPSGSAILGAASLVEMHRQNVVANDAWTESRGLGWGGDRHGDLVTIGHGGGLPGFITDVAMVLPERIAAIVLLNGNGRAHLLGVELLQAVRPVVARARERLAAVPGTAPAPEAWAALTGTYRDPDRANSYRVLVERGTLRIAANGRAGDRLTPTDTADRFEAAGPDGSSRGYVTFVRDGAGRVARLVFDGYAFAEETVAPRYTA